MRVIRRRLSLGESFAADYVATFNATMTAGDFSSLLTRWTFFDIASVAVDIASVTVKNLFD
jgi:hypothetical protein